MKEIGGYFELELPIVNNFPHKGGTALNSGRNALLCVLSSIPRIEKIYIPYYTCDVVLEPINKLGIRCEFYHINSNLEISDCLELSEDEYLLYTNYFGIKDSYIAHISTCYGTRLIVDNAQALYAAPISGINTIYSPRKFVGIPDGGVAYCCADVMMSSIDIDSSYDRFTHLVKRIDVGASNAYGDFKENSRKLKNQPLRKISKLTDRIIQSIDFEDVKERRLRNFQYLHNKLKEFNLLEIPPLTSFSCPMVYPLLVNDDSLRNKLISKGIYVATYWPNVYEWVKEDTIEYTLAKNILPLPIDQRYTTEDMEQIIQIII